MIADSNLFIYVTQPDYGYLIDWFKQNTPLASAITHVETLKKIAHELAESLRKSTSVDWSVRESVRASLRLMVKRILRKYKYPPEKQEEAVQLVLEQAESLCAEWA